MRNFVGDNVCMAVRQSEEWHELAAGDLPKLLVDRLEGFGRGGYSFPFVAEMVCGLYEGASQQNRSWRQPAYPHHESAWYSRTGDSLSRWGTVFSGLAYESEILVYHLFGRQYTDAGTSAKNR